jgi:tRNA 2-thiouridine synthesizing protein A
VSDTLEYDATGLVCPLPVLRANRKMRELADGGLLTVRATDPATEQDFPAYCKQTGHELVSARREGEILIFVIRKHSRQE